MAAEKKVKKTSKKEKKVTKKASTEKKVNATKKIRATKKAAEKVVEVVKEEEKRSDSLLKLFIPMGVGAIAVIVLLILGITGYSFEFNLEEDGYAIPNSTILSAMDASSQETAPLFKFQTGDSVYSQSGNIGKHFVGDNKQGLSPRYPMYTRNGQVLYFLDDSTPIITNEWETLSSYEGLRESNGETFNADNSRADLDEVILVDVDYGYQVAQETNISSDHSKKTIAMNTICEFGESKIDCFEYQNGMISSYSINVYKDSTISIGDNKYKYEDFLVNIGVWKKNTGVLDNTVEVTADEAEATDASGENKKKDKQSYTTELPVKRENTGEVEHAKAAIANDKPPKETQPIIVGWEKPEVNVDNNVNEWVYYFGIGIDIVDPAHTIDSKGVKFSGQVVTEYDGYGDSEYVIDRTKSPRVSTGSSGTLRLSQTVPNTYYLLSYEYTYLGANGSKLLVERYVGCDYVSDDDDETVYVLDASGNRIPDGDGFKTAKLHDPTTGKLDISLLRVYKTKDYDQLNPIEFNFNSENVEIFYDCFQIQDLYYPNMVSAYGKTVEEALANQKLPGDDEVKGTVGIYDRTETYITGFKVEYAKGIHTPAADGGWPESTPSNSIKTFSVNGLTLNVMNRGYVLDYLNVGEKLTTNTDYTYRIVLKDKFDHEFVYTGNIHHQGGEERAANSLHSAVTCKVPPHVMINIPSKTNRGNQVIVNVKYTNSDLCDVGLTPEDNYLFLTNEFDPIVPENAIEVTYVLVDEDGNEITGEHITSKHLPVAVSESSNTTFFKIIGGLNSQTIYNAGVFCSFYNNGDGQTHNNVILDDTTTFMNGSLSSYGTIQYSGFADNITHRRADLHMRLTFNKQEQLFENELLKLLTHIDVTVASENSSQKFTLKKSDLVNIPLTFDDADVTTINRVSYRNVDLVPAYINDNENSVLVKFTLEYPEGVLPQYPITGADPTNLWEYILATSNCNGAAYFTTKLSQIYELDPDSPLDPGQLMNLEKSTSYKASLAFLASNGNGIYEDVTSKSSKPIPFNTLKVEPSVSFADVFISDEFVEIYNLTFVDPDNTITPDKAGSGNAYIKVSEARQTRNADGSLKYDDDGNPVLQKTDTVLTTLFIDTADYPDRDVSEPGTNPTIRINGLVKDKYYVIEVYASEYVNEKTNNNYALMLVMGDTLSIIEEDIFERQFFFNTNGKIVGHINIDSLYRTYVGPNGSELTHLGLLEADDEGIYDETTQTYKYGDWTYNPADNTYTSKRIEVDPDNSKFSIYSSLKNDKVKQSEHNLPVYFTEVDYIQSNGSQYIKTGYFHNEKTEFVAEYLPVRGANTWNVMFGSRSATLKVDTLDFGFNDNTGYYFINTPLNDHNEFYVLDDYTNYQTIRVGGSQIQFDDIYADFFTEEQLIDQNATIGQAAVEDYLFALNSNGAVAYQTRMKLKSAQILENGLVVMDFIPCVAIQDVPAYMVNTQKKAKAGTAGLFDLIGQKFYVSADANFGYEGGAIQDEEYVIPEGLKELEYIQGNNQSYIDTGYYHDYNTVVDAVLLPTKNNRTWNAIFGSRTANTAGDTWDFGYNDDTAYNAYFLNTLSANLNTIAQIKDYSSWNTLHVDGDIFSVDGRVSKTGVAGRIGGAVFSDYLFQFNINDAPTANHWCNAKIKSFKITNRTTGEVYRRFIPVVVTDDTKLFNITGLGYDTPNVRTTTINRNVNKAGEFTGTPATATIGKHGMYDVAHNVLYLSASSDDFFGSDSEGSHEVPDYLKEVKYIQSSGAQVIDTGVVIQNNKLRMQFKMVPTAIKTTGNYYYGNGNGSNNWFSFEHYNGQAYWNMGKTTGWGKHVHKINYTYEFDVKYNSGTATVASTENGNSFYNVSAAYSNTINPVDGQAIAFFSNGPSGTAFSAEKLYYLKIYMDPNNEDSIVRDFIPCVSTTQVAPENTNTGLSVGPNTPGLYDLVTGKFYVNTGSGTFVYEEFGGNETIPSTGTYTVRFEKYDPATDTDFVTLGEVSGELIGNGNIFNVPDGYKSEPNLRMSLILSNVPSSFSIGEMHLENFDEEKLFEINGGERTPITTNLLDGLDTKNNAYLEDYTYNSEGRRITAEGYAVTTEYVPVKPDSVYFVEGLDYYSYSSTNYHRTYETTEVSDAIRDTKSSSELVAFYDSNKAFITTAYVGGQSALFKTPTNAAFARFVLRGELSTISNADTADSSELKLGIPYEVNTYGTRYKRSNSNIYVSFIPTETGDYTFYSSNVVMGDPYLTLCDENKQPIKVNNVVLADDDGDGSLNFKMTATLTKDTTYYLNVTHSNMAVSSAIEYTINVTDSRYLYHPEEAALYLYTPANEERFVATFSGDVFQYDDELKYGTIQVKLLKTKNKVSMSTNLDEYTDDQWRENPTILYTRPNSEAGIGDITEEENLFDNIKINVEAGYGYKAQLFATKYGRTAEILLDDITFTAIQPVYVIKDIPTLRKVANDMSGYYICISDLPAATDEGYIDFTVSNEIFTGVIDWQGHTINLSSANPLFNRLGNTAVLRNANFVFEEPINDIKPITAQYLSQSETQYEVLEYIQSTGTQWINTELNNKDGFEVDMDIEFTGITNKVWYNIIGGHNNDQNTTLNNGSLGWHTSMIRIYQNNALELDLERDINNPNNFITAPNNSIKLNQKHNIKGSTEDYNVFLEIDGNRYHSSYDSNRAFTQVDATIGLLAQRTPNLTVQQYTYAKLYGCKIWLPKEGNPQGYSSLDNGDTPDRDFVPVRRTVDGVLGLYDKIHKTFYPNAGTGKFKAGNNTGDVIDPNEGSGEATADPRFVQLEYVQSTGLQYLVLETKQTNTTDYEFKFERTDKKSVEQNIFGANAATNNRLTITALNDSTTVQARITNNRTFNIGDLNLDKPVIYKLEGNVFSVDDGTVHSTLIERDNDAGNLNISIFAQTYSGGTPAYGKLYYAKVYQDGALTFDGVPVMTTEEIPDAYICGRIGIGSYGKHEAPAGTVGLYDRISGHFYYSFYPLRAPEFMYSDDISEIKSVWDLIGNDQGINVQTRGLPSDFIQVDYIADGGGAYVNTGLNGQQAYHFDTVVGKHAPTESMGAPFGACIKNYQNTGVHMLFNDTVTYCYKGGYNTLSDFHDKEYVNSKYHIVAYFEGNGGYFYVYDATTEPETLIKSTSRSSGNSVTTYPIYIMGSYANDGNRVFRGRMYSMKLYATHNGTLVRDFVPCITARDIDGDRTATGAIAPAGTVGFYDMVQGKFYTSITTTPLIAPTVTDFYYRPVSKDLTNNTACIARDNYGLLSNVILHYGPKTDSAYQAEANSAAMVVNNHGTIDTFALEYTNVVNVKNSVGGVCLNNYGTISNGSVTGRKIADADGNEMSAGLVHRYKTISSVAGVRTKEKVVEDPNADTPVYIDVVKDNFIYRRSTGSPEAGNISYIASNNDTRGKIKNVFVAADIKVESDNSEIGSNGSWTYGINYVAEGLIKVDSITSTGTQWIKTGVNMKDIADHMGTDDDVSDDIEGFRATLKLKWNSFYNGCQEVIGAHNHNSNSTVNNGSKGWHNTYLRTNNSSGQLALGFAENDQYKGNVAANVVYDIDMSTMDKNAYLKLNGTTVYSSTASCTQVDAPIGLFCGMYPNDTPINRSPNYTRLTLYSCQIYAATGELVRDFIPCVASDTIDGSRTNTGNSVSVGTAGLYDTITQLFYVNSGTGKFISSGSFDNTSINTDYTALITGYNSGSVKDCFASGDILDIEYQGTENGLVVSASTVMRRIGPAVGANIDGIDLGNINYVSLAGTEYQNLKESASYMHSFNESSELKSLHDYKWYENKLGADGLKFNIRSSVVANYYPQVIMSNYLSASVIPTLQLPDSNNMIAIIGSDIRQKGKDEFGYQTAVVTLQMDNPTKLTISGINIVDSENKPLDTEVFSQGFIDDTYFVDVIVRYSDSIPGAPLAEHSYTIKSYDTASQSNKAFAHLSGEDILDLDFYHSISTVGEWSNALGYGSIIRESISENYRVTKDIDFSSCTEWTQWIVGAEFKGELDAGEYDVIPSVPIVDYLGHVSYDANGDERLMTIQGDLIGMYTLSGIGNIDKNGNYVSTRGWGNGSSIKSTDYSYTDLNSSRFSLFRLVSGKIQNVIFEDFNTVKVNDSVGFNDVTNAISGVITRTSNGAILDNCHVRNSTFNTRGYGGTLVGYASNTAITNCSARNVVVKGTNYPFCSDPTFLGGLVGYGYNVNIENSFVSDTSIEGAKLDTLAGAGGMIGVADYSSVYGSYVGQGTINVSGSCVGGVIGKVGLNANTTTNDYNYSTTVENCWTTIDVQSDGDFVGGIVGYMGIYNGVEDKPQTNKLLNNFTNSTVLSMNYSATHVNRINCFDFENVNYYYNNFAFENQSINYKNTKATSATGTYQFGPTIDANGATRLLTPDDIRMSSTWYGEIGLDDFCFTFDEIETKELMPKVLNSNTGALVYDQGDEYLGNKDVAKIEIVKAENNTNAHQLKITARLWNYGWNQDTFKTYADADNGVYEKWLDLADWENLTAVGGAINTVRGAAEFPGRTDVDSSDMLVPTRVNTAFENGNYGIEFVTYIDYEDPELGHYADSYMISVPVYLSESMEEPRLTYNAHSLIVLDEDNICAKVLTNQVEWNEFFKPTGSHYNTLEVIKIGDPGQFIFDINADNAYNAGIDRIINGMTNGGKPTFTGQIKYDVTDASFIANISGDVEELNFVDFTVDFNNMANAGPQGIIGSLSAGLKNITFNKVNVKNTMGTSSGIIGETKVGAYLENITMKDITVTAGANKNNVGGLVGKLLGTAAHYTEAKNITIDNFNVTTNNIGTSTTNYGGLFGYSQYATIKDITLTNTSSITSEYKDTSLYQEVSGYNHFEYFQEVEYIESSGNEQWIDTGVKQTNNLDLMTEFEFSILGSHRVFGSVNGSSHYYQFGSDDSSKYKAQSGAGGKEIWPAGPTTYGRHIAGIKDSTKQAIVDGVAYNFVSFSEGNKYNIYLFANNSGNSLGTKSNIRLYSATMITNDGMIRQFVPVTAKKEIPAELVAYHTTAGDTWDHTIEAGTPGLYDTVNHKFYPNAHVSVYGTGQFYAGPKVGRNTEGKGYEYNRVFGYNNLGGVVGNAQYSTISDISVNRTHIRGVYQFGGSIIGRADYCEFDHLLSSGEDGVYTANTFTDIYVDMRDNCIGGAIGCSYNTVSLNGIYDSAEIYDINVFGRSYVGGLMGYIQGYAMPTKKLKAQDIRIVGVYANTGGLFGQTSNMPVDFKNCEFTDIYVTNDDGNTGNTGDNKFGGVIGWSENTDGVTLDECLIKDIFVKGARYVGGFSGQLQNTTSKKYDFYMHNCTVKNIDVIQQYYSTGSDGIVGGVSGEISYMNAYANNGTTIDNINILSNGGVAGGFVGYMYQATDYTPRYIGSSETSDWVSSETNEYTRLKYIASVGAQFIDTGVTTDAKTRVKMITQIDNDRSAFGVALGGSQFHYTSVAPNNYIRFGSYENLNLQPCTNGQYVMIDYFKGVDRYSWNDDASQWELMPNSLVAGQEAIDRKNTINFEFLPADNTMYLFSRNSANAQNDSMTGKIYECWIWKDCVDGSDDTSTEEVTDGRLVRHYVPVRRNLDNKLGMLDTLTNTFYPNKGTGAFTAGPVVQETESKYEELDFLQSNGTQWIDTGVSIQDGDEANGIKFVFDAIVSKSSFCRPFGFYESSIPSRLLFQTCSSNGYELYHKAGSARVPDSATRYGYKQKYEIQVKSGDTYVKIDDQLVYSDTETVNLTKNKNIGLFNLLNNSGALFNDNNNKGLTLYNMSIYKGDELVRKYIPVKRNSDEQLGMLDISAGDIENGTLYLNKGVGSFTAGYKHDSGSEDSSSYLKVNNVNIQTYGHYAGGIMGRTGQVGNDPVTLQYCSVDNVKIEVLRNGNDIQDIGGAAGNVAAIHDVTIGNPNAAIEVETPGAGGKSMSDSSKIFEPSVIITGYTSYNVGGAVGLLGLGAGTNNAYARDSYNVNVYNVKLESHYVNTDRFGGFAGYYYSGDAHDITVENVTINGAGCNGGLVAYRPNRSEAYCLLYNNTVKDTIVTGSGTDKGYGVGGIVGKHEITNVHTPIYGNKVENCFIAANTAVGGIAGKVNNASIYDNEVVDTMVLSDYGRYVGGIVGEYPTTNVDKEIYRNSVTKERLYRTWDSWDVIGDKLKVCYDENQSSVKSTNYATQVSRVSGDTNSYKDTFNKFNTKISGLNSYPMAILAETNIAGEFAQQNVGGIAGFFKGKALHDCYVGENVLVASDDSYTNTTNKASVATGGLIGYTTNPVDQSNTAFDADFIQLEYVEDTGQAYLDTLYNVTSTAKAEIKFMKNAKAASGTYWESALFGTNWTSNVFLLNIQSNILYFHGPGVKLWTGLSNTKPIVATIEKNGGSIKYHAYEEGGTNNVTGNTTDSVGASRLYVLLTNSWRYGAKGRMYYFKLWDNGKLIRDMIPVMRRADGAVGMYDKVDHRFYRNVQPTDHGDFIAGNEYHSGSTDKKYNKYTIGTTVYEAVDYVLSNGGQTINSGVKSNNNTKWELDYLFTSRFGRNNQSQQNGGAQIGAGKADDKERFLVYTTGANYAFGLGKSYDTGIVNDFQRHTFTLDSHTMNFTYDGKVLSINAADRAVLKPILNMNSDIYYFDRNIASSTYYHPAKMYSSKIWHWVVDTAATETTEEVGHYELQQYVVPVRTGSESNNYTYYLLDIKSLVDNDCNITASLDADGTYHLDSAAVKLTATGLSGGFENADLSTGLVEPREPGDTSTKVIPNTDTYIYDCVVGANVMSLSENTYSHTDKEATGGIIGCFGVKSYTASATGTEVINGTVANTMRIYNGRDVNLLKGPNVEAIYNFLFTGHVSGVNNASVSVGGACVNQLSDATIKRLTTSKNDHTLISDGQAEYWHQKGEPGSIAMYLYYDNDGAAHTSPITLTYENKFYPIDAGASLEQLTTNDIAREDQSDPNSNPIYFLKTYTTSRAAGLGRMRVSEGASETITSTSTSRAGSTMMDTRTYESIGNTADDTGRSYIAGYSVDDATLAGSDAVKGKFYYGASEIGSMSLGDDEPETRTWWMNILGGSVPLTTSRPPMLTSLARTPSNTLAAQLADELVIYSSGIDTINFELPSAPLSEVEYTITTLDGTTKGIWPAGQKTITASFDYNSSIAITLSSGGESSTVTRSSADVANSVMTYGNSYWYLYEDKVLNASGKSINDNATFIHMYDGKLLDTKGNIYNASNARVVDKARGLAVIDTKPLWTGTISSDGQQHNIKTFATYSLSDDVNIDARLYVKNNTLFTLSASTNIKSGPIIDSYGGKLYATVLLDTNSLVDLGDTIKYPDGFKKSMISEISNTMNYSGHYVLVRYSNRTLAVFDYLTGNEIDAMYLQPSSLESLGSFLKSSLNRLLRPSSSGTHESGSLVSASEYETNIARNPSYAQALEEIERKDLPDWDIPVTEETDETKVSRESITSDAEKTQISDVENFEDIGEMDIDIDEDEELNTKNTGVDDDSREINKEKDDNPDTTPETKEDSDVIEIENSYVALYNKENDKSEIFEASDILSKPLEECVSEEQKAEMLEKVGIKAIMPAKEETSRQMFNGIALILLIMAALFMLLSILFYIRRRNFNDGN